MNLDDIRENVLNETAFLIKGIGGAKATAIVGNSRVYRILGGGNKITLDKILETRDVLLKFHEYDKVQSQYRA